MGYVSGARAILLLLIVVSSASAATFENLGPQVTGTTIQGRASARAPSGRLLVYTVERGEPGHLLAFDVAGGRNVLDLPMPGSDGSWEITVAGDGRIYTAAGNGHLFRHQPGTQTLQDLGQAPPEE